MTEAFVYDAIRTPRGKGACHRGLEFLLPWPPDGVTIDDEPRMAIRGVIDCLWRDEAGDWHLLGFSEGNKGSRSCPPSLLE